MYRDAVKKIGEPVSEIILFEIQEKLDKIKKTGFNEIKLLHEPNNNPNRTEEYLLINVSFFLARDSSAGLTGCSKAEFSVLG